MWVLDGLFWRLLASSCGWGGVACSGWVGGWVWWVLTVIGGFLGFRREWREAKGELTSDGEEVVSLKGAFGGHFRTTSAPCRAC